MFDRAAKQGHNLSGICNVEKLGPPKEIFVSEDGQYQMTQWPWVIGDSYGPPSLEIIGEGSEIGATPLAEDGKNEPEIKQQRVLKIFEIGEDLTDDEILSTPHSPHIIDRLISKN